MKSRLACLVGVLLILPQWQAQYRTALPGYLYEFPRDHFDHPDFQTEWWYCTGNVKSADGSRFGFELIGEEFMVHPTGAAHFKSLFAKIDCTRSRQPRERNVV